MTRVEMQPVRLELPLPADMVASIIAACAAMWPDTTIATGGAQWRADMLTLLVPARRPKVSGRRTLAGCRVDGVGEVGELTELSDRRTSVLLPEEARDALAEVALAFITGVDAINYVEQTLTLPVPHNGHTRLVFTVQWADGKTPHELRCEAEAKLANAITTITREDQQ